MPKIGTMTSSKFLKKDDFPEEGTVVTFSRFVKENVAKDNEPPDVKWVAYFDGEDKGLVLNKTNLKRAAAAMGSDDTDDWLGKQIVAYFDENVEFGGELVGGIRLRAPKGDKAAPKSKAESFDDDIPF